MSGGMQARAARTVSKLGGSLGVIPGQAVVARHGRAGALWSLLTAGRLDSPIHLPDNQPYKYNKSDLQDHFLHAFFNRPFGFRVSNRQIPIWFHHREFLIIDRQTKDVNSKNVFRHPCRCVCIRGRPSRNRAEISPDLYRMTDEATRLFHTIMTFRLRSRAAGELDVNDARYELCRRFRASCWRSWSRPGVIAPP